MAYGFDYTPSWELDTNGFYRCKARFLSTGTMPYKGSEISDDLDPEGIYSIMVDDDQLANPESLRSLEGMPVVSFGHEWAEVDGDFYQVGSVAGTPDVKNGFVEGELLITDQKTIEALQNKELCDISSAYNTAYDMIPGNDEGLSYDGKQLDIRYNHVAILPPGKGRAGRNVRVLNSKSGDTMDNTKYTLPSGKVVQVAEDAVSVIAGEIKRAENQTPEGGMSMDDMNMKMKELADATAMVETLRGELMAVKEQLDAAMSMDNMEETVNQTMKDREEGSEMMMANNVYEDREKAMNSLDGLFGHQLRSQVVTSVRAQNGLPELTTDQLESEGFVGGVYEQMKTFKPVEQKAVAGATVVKTAQNAAPSQRSAQSKLGYSKEK